MCADPDIDIVDLGTRPSVRLPMVLAALAHGKHIYNACPHAPDWAGAKAIDAAWHKAGTIGVVDAFSEHIPALRKMRDLLDHGYAGTLLGGSCRFTLSLFNQPDKCFPYNWFADGTAGVSAIRNNGSHMLFMLQRLFGPVAELVADDRQILTRWTFSDGDSITPDTSDYTNIILRFATGIVLPMQISWSMTLHHGWMIDVFGTEGRLVAESPTFPTTRDCTLRGGPLGGEMQAIAIPKGLAADPGVAIDGHSDPQPSYPIALSMRDMVRAIKGEAVASPDFAAALEVERLQEAIRLSALERRWVRAGDVT